MAREAAIADIKFMLSESCDLLPVKTGNNQTKEGRKRILRDLATFDRENFLSALPTIRNRTPCAFHSSVGQCQSAARITCHRTSWHRAQGVSGLRGTR